MSPYARTYVSRKEDSGLSRTICQRLRDGCWFLATSLVALCTANASKKRQRNVAAREAAKASFSTLFSFFVFLSLLAARWCAFLLHTDRRYKSSRWDQKPARICRQCSIVRDGKPCARSHGQIIRCIISSQRCSIVNDTSRICLDSRREGSCMRWKYRARDTFDSVACTARRGAKSRELWQNGIKIFRRLFAKLVKILNSLS